MNVTEEQAAKLWCPMVRFNNVQDAAFNRVHDPEPIGEWNNCIGSRCMMWAWHRFNEDTGVGVEGHCGMGAL